MKLRNCRQIGNDFIFEKSGGEVIFKLKPEESSKFFAFDFENKNDFAARIEIHFYKKISEKPDFSITTGVLPAIRTKVEIPLAYLDGQALFGERRYGLLKTVVVGKRMAQEEIRFVGVHMAKCHVEPRLTISHPQFTSNSDQDQSFDFDSLIDEFGQRREGVWPGKTQDLAELSAYLNGELDKANNFLLNLEDGFYGTGPVKYEATGFYRVKRIDKNWQMITPDGRDFWGFGCDVVEPRVTGPLSDGLEHEFALSNLTKVWADKAYDNWQTLTKYRLIKWGINTIAAWSDLDFAKQAKLPYVKIFEDFPWTADKIYRDFPDVFSQEYHERALKYAEELRRYADDPYLIGYFMANEPNWAFVKGLNLGYECFCSPSSLRSKRELVHWLKKRYKKDIADLNQDFKTSFVKFNDILEVDLSLKISAKGKKILDEFSKVLIREFIRVPAEALRAVDDKHLNLGIRYAFISSPALFSGAEFLDIFSINCYDNSCEEAVKQVNKATDKPVMIGEFHFGALDRGLPATGIRGVASQKDRGKAISAYLDAAIRTGVCVGAHYFCLYDQPYLGRFDGENYNIGLLDICNREYTELTELMQPIARIPEIFF